MRKVRLKDIGTFYSGLSGKSKKDFSDGNALLATYRNIFNNPVLNLDIKDTVVIGNGEKQNEVMYGDILFTGSSETPEEAGMSSVVMSEPKEKIYLNSFCFGFRLNNIIEVLPSYMGHLLRSEPVRKAISKTAFGVTRFNINKNFLSEIEIPLPPLTIQREIVSVLDSFTTLIDKMKQEVELRKKQMKYYREKLICEQNYPLESIGKIGEIDRGSGLQKKDFAESGIGCIHYGQIYTRLNSFCDKTLTFVTPKLAERLTKVHPGDLIIACTSENIEDVCKSVVWLGEEDIVTGGHACVLRHKENPKYISYCFQTADFALQKAQFAYGAKVIDIKTDNIKKISIPVPPLSTQRSIVSTLDAFEQYISKLERLITLREKQYVYYREKLLTFE